MIPESVIVAIGVFVIAVLGAGGLYLRASVNSFASRRETSDTRERFYLETAQSNQVELRELRAKYDAIDKELDTAKQTITLMQNEREGANSEVATLKKRVEELEKRVEELVAQKQTLAQELSDEKLSRQRDNSDSAKEIASLKNEVKQILAAQMPPGASTAPTATQEPKTIIVDTIEADNLTVATVKPKEEKKP